MEHVSANDTERKAQKIIAVMSGKGGVGKSVVSGLLAAALQRQGAQVGVLDGDLISPSMVNLFGTDIQLSLDDNGAIEPLTSPSGVKIMSMNIFQENAYEPTVWRGPMISSAFKQFYSEIGWGRLDYLIVDAPTGTSDVPMTILHSLRPDGIILVSLPQKLATTATQRCVNMIQQLQGHIIGFVENMSCFVAPDGECYELFGPSNCESLMTMADAPLLAQLPFDPLLATCCDMGHIEAYRSEDTDRLVANCIAALG
jgi:Mrp family chromosome partitioning ATPase